MKPAIIKRSALLLALACVLTLLGAPRASAANQVADIQIKAVLQDDGSADITQTWTATTDEGTEFYLACRDNGYLSITDFTVSDERGTYEPLASWDVGADFTQKARKCGVVETGEGVELCWGISEYGTHTYTLRYALHGLVGAYDDADGFNYRFIDEMGTFPTDVELTLTKADGTPLRVDIRSASAMIENRRVRILCATDVTERIEMEQKFIQAGKMATLGEMATGVAHELNQPLTVIKGAASYFLRKTRRSEPIAPETLSELSVEISGQVDRASDIINHMRAFGRKSDLALLDTDINGVVAQACDLFGRQLVVHGITLETSLAPALPTVLAIPNRLEQVIVNLILNARDAVEERVKSAPEPPAVIGVSTVMDGNTVLLSVWDTGTGIPAHLLNKIFEPFFTTKPVGKGTGLGLSIIYGLVKDFGGSISARNRDEGGALFEIRLPITRRGDLAPNAPADGNRAGGVSGPQPEQIS